MAESLIEQFRVGRDLVALVGAGGKTTLAFAIGRELRRRACTVIVTTTTRFGADQTDGLPVVPPDRSRVAAVLSRSGACLVLARREAHKAVGVSPRWVDATWRAGIADAIVVEADGARRRKVKAPAAHEPVVPQAATLVIAVMSAAALGGVIADVAHRPELVAAVLAGIPEDRLTPEAAARLLTSPRGGRKSVPAGARFVVAVTGVSAALRPQAGHLSALLEPVPAVLIPENR